MDKQIKEFVKTCRIHEKKEQLIETKKKLFKLEREMAKLTMDYGVGTYVHMYEEYLNLKVEKYLISGAEYAKINTKMVSLNKKLKRMETIPEVSEYLELKKEYMMYLNTIGDYGKTINTQFRSLFYEYEVPNIYVFQGYADEDSNSAVAHNIIVPSNSMLFREARGTIIYPQYNLTSNRDLRHFYNKVSFKYLEGMTEDYSFDLDVKNIGKARVRKKSV